MQKGTAFALAAYTIWGLLPLYWKLLKSVPPFEILCHRTLGAALFIAVLISVQKRWSAVRAAAGARRTRFFLFVSAVLLSLNWLTFIWAVNTGFVLEVSLGYFINPLVTVSLGVLLLKERMRPLQWTAAGIALSGVLYLAAGYGRVPWIGLILAFSFALYGLLKKTGTLRSLDGLFSETAVMSLPALAYLVFVETTGSGTLSSGAYPLFVLLLTTGTVTAYPLLLFAKAARRIPLSQIGFFQYIAPILHFLIGYLVYHEPLSRQRLSGFIIIWFALAVYTADSLHAARRRNPAPAPVP
ncbi:EamA family transporter RarD [bacterium]|nr:EamA family transporter RarD [bacterium]